MWICFPGILLAAGIAMLFDIVAMRSEDTAIESAAVKSSSGQGIKRWDLVGATAVLKVAELATASIAAIYYVKLLRYFIS